MKNKMSIRDSVLTVGAERSEFCGVEYKAECCGSKIGRGNSMFGIVDHYGEVQSEMCGRCLKKYAYYKKHQHDDFCISEYGN